MSDKERIEVEIDTTKKSDVEDRESHLYKAYADAFDKLNSEQKE